jgi:hypothetical protein
MRPKSLLPLLACATAAFPSALFSGQAEADFNDMFLGSTRTRGDAASANNGNLNRGSGFLAATVAADGGAGEYNNDTGVAQFEAGDLGVPAGVGGFVSVQGSSGTGIVFGSGAGTTFRRMQDRHFATPMATAGGEVWFSYLYRLQGPNAEAQVFFNSPVTTSSASQAGAFGVSMGAALAPGALALNLDPLQSAANLLGSPGFPANPNLLRYDDLDGSGAIDGTETDLNNNGLVDGVEVGLFNAANAKSHLVIGRIVVDPAPGAPDLIQIWHDPANVADLASLGTPTLTASSDEISATGVFSIGLEVVRGTAPAPVGGPYISGGKSAIDHLRVSDQPNALDYVTGNVLPDPDLAIDVTSPAPNFNFAGVYGSGSPITSAPRTIKLVNSGLTQDIVINSLTFQNGNAAGVFSITSAPPLPKTLAPGESTTVSVEATSATFSTLFSETLVIDTDEDSPGNPQDMTVPVAATFFTAGSRVNLNPTFNTNLADWRDDAFNFFTPSVRVLPGFDATGGMVRIKGVGDVVAGAPDNLSQAVLNGAADWEFAFKMSPVAAADFAKYAGIAPAAVDRTFQVIIQSDSKVPEPASGTEGTWTNDHNADASLINLAYFPAANDFGVFDGSTWQMLNIGPISGSTDITPAPVVTPLTDTDGDGINDAWEEIYFPGDPNAINGTTNSDADPLSDLQEFIAGTSPITEDSDGDTITDDADHHGNGSLSAATGDTVNWHLVRIKGTGFGTGAAAYSVSVSAANSTVTADSATGLTHFDATDGTTSTPGGYTFTSGDISDGSSDNGAALATTYWFDDVSFFATQAPDPELQVGTVPTIIAHNGTALPGNLVITNGGFTNDLTVSALNFAGGSVFTTTQTLPLVVPAGTSVNVPVILNPASIPAPNNAVADTLTVVSDGFPVSTRNVILLGAATTDTQMLPNWNLEVPGTDVVGDTDTFATWADNTTVINVAGLVPGSATAACLGAGASLINSLGAPAAGFEIRFPFTMQTPGAGSDRLMNLQLRTAAGINGTEEVNLRISNAASAQVQLFNGVWTSYGPTFSPALSTDANADGDFDDGGDTKNVYTFVLSGSNWGTAAPTFGFKLIGPNGVTVLSELQGLTLAQAFRDQVDVLTSPLGRIDFLTTSGQPRFCVDNVNALLVIPSEVNVTGFTGGPGGFTITWDSGGTPVTVSRSTDLINWTDISLGDADGTHTDLTAPSGRAFYRVELP